MADVDPNLVKAIAEQVLAAIRAASAGGGRIGASLAEIHAPIGQCTGDYSKFPELRNLQSAPGPENKEVSKSGMPNGAPAPQGMAPAPVTSLKGVITESHLRSVKGAIRLAKGAILTPLAQDYIREKNLNVMTDEQAVATKVNAGPAAGASNAPTFWWIEGQCSSVAKVIESLRPNVWASRERSSGENLRAVVKELAGLVKSKKVGAGLLFVQSAARASVYANRCHSLRAIVGTSDKAVSDGIEQLGANVLILEYPLHGFKSMSALIAPFLASLHQMPEPVRKELNELTACG